jgi:hypothetical protein
MLDPTMLPTATGVVSRSRHWRSSSGTPGRLPATVTRTVDDGPVGEVNPTVRLAPQAS